jgi:hypothetical protein
MVTAAGGRLDQYNIRERRKAGPPSVHSRRDKQEVFERGFDLVADLVPDRPAGDRSNPKMRVGLIDDLAQKIGSRLLHLPRQAVFRQSCLNFAFVRRSRKYKK